MQYTHRLFFFCCLCLLTGTLWGQTFTFTEPLPSSVQVCDSSSYILIVETDSNAAYDFFWAQRKHNETTWQDFTPPPTGTQGANSYPLSPLFKSVDDSTYYRITIDDGNMSVSDSMLMTFSNNTTSITNAIVTPLEICTDDELQLDAQLADSEGDPSFKNGQVDWYSGTNVFDLTFIDAATVDNGSNTIETILVNDFSDNIVVAQYHQSSNQCLSIYDFESVTIFPVPDNAEAVYTDSCLNGMMTVELTNGEPNATVEFFLTATALSPTYTIVLDGAGDETLSYAPISPSPGIEKLFYELENSEGCRSARDSVMTTIVTQPIKPTVQDNPVCSGFSTTLNIVNPIDSLDYAWYDDGGLTNIVGTDTIFTTPVLTIPVSFFATAFDPATGCLSNPLTRPVTVHSNPVAVIEAVEVQECLNIDHEFIASNSQNGSGGTITSVFWDFGDAMANDDTLTASLANSVTYGYPDVGNYTVFLSVVDTEGCVHDTTTSVEVLPLPVRIPPEDLDSSYCVNAGPSSLPSPIQGFGYNWSGDCVNASDEFDPGCVGVGSDTLEVIILDNNGCVNTFQHVFIVRPIPTADFVIDNVCLKSSVSPIDESMNQEEYDWTLDGMSFSTEAEPLILFEAIADTGEHTLKLMVNSDGCQDTTSATFRVYALPVPEFPIPSSPCPGEEVEFNASTSKALYGGTLSYSWDFGDGSGMSEEEVPEYSFAVADTSYPITLIVGELSVDGFTCFDTLSQDFSTLPEPRSLFTFRYEDGSPCFTHPILFEDMSEASGGSSIEDIVWDFGDGTSPDPDRESSFSYTYGLPDSVGSEFVFMPTLTVTDDNGCVDVSSLDVMVDYSGPTIIDEPLKLGVDLLVSRDDGAMSYQWYMICAQDTSLAPGDSARQFYCVKPENNDCDFFVVTKLTEGGCETRSKARKIEGREGFPISSLFTRGMTLYPNPNYGNFSLELIHEVQGVGEIRVVDLSGRLLYGERFEKGGSFSTHKVSRALSPGLYIVEMRFDNGVWFSQKMMVQ